MAVSADPARETAQRALLQCLAASGNYAAAIQAYRDLRLHLHQELNAEPDAETKALFDAIRAEARGRSAAGGEAAEVSRAPSGRKGERESERRDGGAPEPDDPGSARIPSPDDPITRSPLPPAAPVTREATITFL